MQDPGMGFKFGPIFPAILFFGRNCWKEREGGAARRPGLRRVLCPCTLYFFPYLPKRFA